jgi:CarD family transcriptional regulator
MPFSVGDTVVYPHHGAAVIERTERRELKGEVCDYLVLRLTYGDLTLMVPADSCEEVGIRKVVSKRESERVLDVLRTRAEGRRELVAALQGQLREAALRRHLPGR